VSFEIEKTAKEIKKLYEQVRAQIEKMNEQYKPKANKNRFHLGFEPTNLVWIPLKNEGFP